MRHDVKGFMKLLIPPSLELVPIESPKIRPVNIGKWRGMRNIEINPIRQRGIEESVLVTVVNRMRPKSLRISTITQSTKDSFWIRTTKVTNITMQLQMIEIRISNNTSVTDYSDKVLNALRNLKIPK